MYSMGQCRRFWHQRHGLHVDRLSGRAARAAGAAELGFRPARLERSARDQGGGIRVGPHHGQEGIARIGVRTGPNRVYPRRWPWLCRCGRLPPLDERTILCLQAGEVNTGAFDPFDQIIPIAQKAGAWVHVDGAFGLWARASSLARLTQGIEQADSWTTDAQKWLNTPYDCAMTICRDARALAEAMDSDAVYSSASVDAQKNLTLEFSRRPRGIPVWAALRSMGRQGVAELVERHCAQARRIGDGLTRAGFEVLNQVTLNQALFRCSTDAQTLAVRAAVHASGEVWFGGTVWQGRPAMRISVSSWRTQDAGVDALLTLMARLLQPPSRQIR